MGCTQRNDLPIGETMLNPYHEQIDIQRVLALQNSQYQVCLYTQIEVGPGEQVDQSVNISSIGHFLLLTMTGSYTSKIADGPETYDGICKQSVQLTDGSNDRQLFEDFIPANLFLSPGRIQSISGVGNASEPLRREFAFVYCFLANGQIIVKVKNHSDVANTTRIMFKGIRVFTQARQSM